MPCVDHMPTQPTKRDGQDSPNLQSRPGSSFADLNTNRHIGLARAVNKAGFASRSQAEKLVRQGMVRLNGKIVLDPERPTTERDRIEIDGKPLEASRKVYLMCNKPRGLVTTAEDERGRATVFQCLQGLDLPHVGPVGRLDMASEGLLLFTNDTSWANALLDPANRIPKTYHVQVEGAVDETTLDRMTAGISDKGELLRADSVTVLRAGTRRLWLEVVLREGKNREIRRMAAACGLEILRLVRVRLACLDLGDLPKGGVRELTRQEVLDLGGLFR